jgi:hypothetical protein
MGEKCSDFKSPAQVSCRLHGRLRVDPCGVVDFSRDGRALGLDDFDWLGCWLKSYATISVMDYPKLMLPCQFLASIKVQHAILKLHHTLQLNVNQPASREYCP